MRKIYSCIGCGRRLHKRGKSAMCRACFFRALRAEDDDLVFAGLVRFKRRTGGLTPTGAELAAEVGAEAQLIRRAIHRLAAAGRIQMIGGVGVGDRWRGLLIPGEVWTVKGGHYGKNDSQPRGN